MARLAWATMTRVTADRQQPVTSEPRVDAGVKELNEMTIGRTDDPENPLGATACEAASVFGTGSRTLSGPAVMAPRRQAGHMIAIDPPVRLLIFPLASKRPSTHAPTRSSARAGGANKCTRSLAWITTRRRGRSETKSRFLARL